MFHVFSLNKVILILIACEFILTTSFGLLVPVFALFVVEEVTAGTAQVVGFALAIYWIVKSIIQLPIGRLLDRNHGEVDDFWTMVAGYVAGGVLGILFYFFVKEVWHVYLFQVLWGIADALIVPPFYAIFSRHLDRNQEGFEWSLRSSFSFGAGSAIGGALGGVFAGIFGLRSVFLFMGIGVILGSIPLLLLRSYILPKAKAPKDRVFLEKKML